MKTRFQNIETWNRLPDRVKLTEKPEFFKKELEIIIVAWIQKEWMEEGKEARKLHMLYRKQIRILTISTQVESQPRDIQHSYRQ